MRLYKLGRLHEALAESHAFSISWWQL